ncbi:MAG: hypothetical protein NVSMB9_37070 [Isosphaeraceae bacterium]
MSRERMGSLTRRTVLTLFPLLCLGTIGPGCSPAGEASTSSGTPRFDKMRGLRGTGDPRQKRKPSNRAAPRKSALR